MFKKNKFKQKNGNLILYPDYGNVKGFFVISIFCLLFCYALYSVNMEHNNIGIANMFYIIICTLLFLSFGFLTAYKKVLFDNKSKTVKVLFLGIKFKEILFAEILKIEERSGTIPSAFYIILRKNHLGTSLRLSPPYNPRKPSSKIEFCDKILPLVNTYLTNKNVTNSISKKIVVRHFKQKRHNLYQYVSFYKILYSIILLSLSIFTFTLVISFSFNNLSVIMIFTVVLMSIAGLFTLIKALLSLSITRIDVKEKKLIQKSLLGFSLLELPFAHIQNIQVQSVLINGILIYKNLIVITEENSCIVSKSITSQLLSDLDKELRELLNRPNFPI